MIARPIRTIDRLGIAFRIHELRKDAKETQKQFGIRFNVERQAVWRWENRVNIPSMQVVREMAEQLNTSVEWILYGSDET